jgi:Asp-tRNA(Asn)/Glu-tRNA(Gln) amidotransferase A subunit family amidase
MSQTPNTLLADTTGLLLSIATAIAVVLVLDRIYSKIKTHDQRTTLKRIAARAVQECRATTQTCLAQASDEEAVYTVAETQDLFKRATLSPAQNVLNLATRCRKYGRGQVNAITEELYDAAYEIAQTLEENTDVNKTGPLYGIPVSIKDCINQRDCYASAGLACRMHERSKHDALIVQTLKKAGAIPLCRGNVPQLLMSMESNNSVWGRTSNPWDLTRAPGGSTGGDAALVAMGCIPSCCR